MMEDCRAAFAPAAPVVTSAPIPCRVSACSRRPAHPTAVHRPRRLLVRLEAQHNATFARTRTATVATAASASATAKALLRVVPGVNAGCSVLVPEEYKEERSALSGEPFRYEWAMADISKGKPGIGGKKGLELDTGGGGGVAVITKPRVDKKTARKSKTEKEPSWRVLLHNDDVHTFDYVTGAIVKVVRTVSRKKAHRITMQAHSSGVATVTTTWKALAEDYCKGLQMQGLTSSIAPDSSFKA
jgi:ATP-dependent Clp protease adapter protein ClpS